VNSLASHRDLVARVQPAGALRPSCSHSYHFRNIRHSFTTQFAPHSYPGHIQRLSRTQHTAPHAGRPKEIQHSLTSRFAVTVAAFIHDLVIWCRIHLSSRLRLPVVLLLYPYSIFPNHNVYNYNQYSKNRDSHHPTASDHITHYIIKRVAGAYQRRATV
jgi:hypothetical protein